MYRSDFQPQPMKKRKFLIAPVIEIKFYNRQTISPEKGSCVLSKLGKKKVELPVFIAPFGIDLMFVFSVLLCLHLLIIDKGQGMNEIIISLKFCYL